MSDNLEDLFGGQIPSEKQEERKIEPMLLVKIANPVHEPELFNPIWDVIKPYVKQISDLSGGEYNEGVVAARLINGASYLLMGYWVENQELLRICDTPQGANVAVSEMLKAPAQNLVGYMVLNIDEKSVHIWQAFLTKEYQSTDMMEKSYQWVEENIAQRYGIKDITFSSLLPGWERMGEKLGFKKTATLYRKQLP